MKTEVIIRIAQDFTRFPAGRFTGDGPYSGELFRQKLLEPHLAKGETIVVDFDGALGYGSSFLEEAFGGLIRDGYGATDLLGRLIFKSKDESLKREVIGYIERASKSA
jgi:STAS-like domain of unknown function (DUF4325)